MILNEASSLCLDNQKIIISSENGRTHVARNPKGQLVVKHYHLDGDIVKYQTCCDYLLLNVSRKNSFFIELKGQDIRKAVIQVLAAEDLCKDDLIDFTSYYRIVTSKVRTAELHSTEYQRLLRKVGNARLKCSSIRMEEKLM